MSFTKQGGSIEQSLVAGGLSPLAANAVMYAIANCAQPLEHRGPFTINYVPQQVRLQTPERAKYSYEKFNFQTSEGERRPLKIIPGDPGETPYDPYDPGPQSGCDLTTVCDRLDALEAQLQQVFAALDAIAATFGAANAAVSDLQRRVTAIEDALRNTTDCPQSEATPEPPPEPQPEPQPEP
jgi:hypothetical protein